MVFLATQFVTRVLFYALSSHNQCYFVLGLFSLVSLTCGRVGRLRIWFSPRCCVVGMSSVTLTPPLPSICSSVLLFDCLLVTFTTRNRRVVFFVFLVFPRLLEGFCNVQKDIVCFPAPRGPTRSWYFSWLHVARYKFSRCERPRLLLPWDIAIQVRREFPLLPVRHHN